MKLLRYVTLAVAGAVFAACSSVVPGQPTELSARLQTLRLELPTDVDVLDVPRMMAADTLREQGYTVEPLDFQDNALSVQALVQGTVDFSFVGTGFSWKAIQEGAALASILDGTLNQAALIVTSDIQQCADLDGKIVAVPSLASNRNLYLKKYVAKHCPEATVEPIVISSQTNSLLAMMTGQASGAVIDHADMVAFEAKEHAGLYALVMFANEYPGLLGANVVTRRDFIEKNPQVVQDFIRANLEARRKIQDPQVFAEMLARYRNLELDEAKSTVQLFANQPMWDVNGGLSPQSVQANLEFLTEAASIEPGLTPSLVADLAPLNTVLDQIGRK